MTNLHASTPGKKSAIGANKINIGHHRLSLFISHSEDGDTALQDFASPFLKHSKV